MYSARMVCLVGIAISFFCVDYSVLGQTGATKQAKNTNSQGSSSESVAELKSKLSESQRELERLRLRLDDSSEKLNNSTVDLQQVRKLATSAGQDALQATQMAQRIQNNNDTLKQMLDDSSANLEKHAQIADEARQRGDTAWMLVSSALVMFMIPGLALFYSGMVRRKNVLATMMQSMACLAIIGVYWIVFGYALAFGPSQLTISALGVEQGGLVGWSADLFFLRGIDVDQRLPGTNIPVLAHVMFQGMFAIITPALISGALAERIRFMPFCLFSLLWVTLVYCPLAHMVWAFDWFYPTPLDAAKGAGASAVGLFGKMGALDFAGGTVVHIAAGVAGLAAALVLRKRDGYPQLATHPNSMVLTLLGAGLLWFGWFGFNGGSAGGSTTLAVSAFAATQAAAAAAGLAWMLIEYIHKGKPTGLGLASGVVAGLVAVTPASGYIYPWAGLMIGAVASVVCYLAVAIKNKLGYDDSLDAFGVHGVGGFVGALLTGIFCYAAINPAAGPNGTGVDGIIAYQGLQSQITKLESELIPHAEKANSSELASLREELAKARDAVDLIRREGPLQPLWVQLKAAVFAVVYALIVSAFLAAFTHLLTRRNFTISKRGEIEGLDRSEHGEVGFDFGFATETVAISRPEPRSASAPKGNGKFDLVVEGVSTQELLALWSSLCQPSEQEPDPDFLAVYPHVTTVSGNKFRCRGGDPPAIASRLEKLFRNKLPGKTSIRVVRI